jgi:protocatechuate 3,4-dioxygenase beta subunit
VVVEGRVVGLRGEPVPGATVVLLRFPVRRSEPLERSLDPIFDLTGSGWVTTGADGGFRIETAPVPAAGLIAWGAGHANTLVTGFALEEDVRGLVLRFEPAGALEGHVVREPGPEAGAVAEPVSGAAVSLLQKGPTGRWIVLRTVSTDEQGAFRTWGWSPGVYSLLVEKEGLRASLVADVALPQSGLEVRLAAAATAPLDGTVVLSDGMTPVPGAQVRARSAISGRAGAGSEQETRTDAAGRFRFDGLEVAAGPAGTWVRLDADAGARGLGAGHVELQPQGGSARIVLLAPVAEVLRGRLLGVRSGEAPAGIEGVGLLLEARLPNPWDPNMPLALEREARTGPGGEFEAGGLPAGGVFLSLAITESRWELQKAQPFRVPDPPAQGPWTVEVEAVPRARITGRVVGPDGGPVAGARIEDPGTRPQRGAITGADGRFALDGIPTLRRRGVVLRVEADGFLSAWTDPLSLEPGSRYEGLLVSLPVRLVPVTGHAVDEEGTGFAGAEVSAVAVRGGGPATVSGRGTIAGPGGAYRLEVRPGTEFRVRAGAKGYRAAESEILIPGDAMPDLVLRPEPAPGTAPR